jgi:hypothetical protein
MNKISHHNFFFLFLGIMIGVLLCLSISLFSQVKEILKPDALLEKLKKQLPANWSMYIENERLIVKRNEPAYMQITNLINAPVMLVKKEQQEKEIKKQGKEIFCTFVFRVEPRWLPERLEKAKNFNGSIDRKMSQLEEKHHITKLYNPNAKSAANLYRGKTEEEKRRIRAYEQEKNELEKKRIRFPDYMSEDYSLFLIEKEGMQDQFTLIYPEEASREMYLIENKFREILFHDIGNR